MGGDFKTILGIENALNLRTVTTLASDEGIITGRTYRFKYRCFNKNGWSEFSDETYILAAQVPAKPKAP